MNRAFCDLLHRGQDLATPLPDADAINEAIRLSISLDDALQRQLGRNEDMW